MRELKSHTIFLLNTKGRLDLKALYFDCSSGISGNMTLGALLEIVGDEKYFLDEREEDKVEEYKKKGIFIYT